MKDARTQLKHDLALEVLNSTGEARLPVTGTSMLPALWPGDVVEVRRQSMAETLPGEIVVFDRDGRLLTHRVVGKVDAPEGVLLIARGDALRRPDPAINPEELLGRVTAIWRGGRRLEPRLTYWGRVAAWVFSRSTLFVRVALRLRRRLIL